VRRAGRAELAAALRATRECTWRLLDGLEPAQWQVPRRETVNLPLWEIGHVGWFQERWCLREPRRPGGPVAPSALDGADRWFDSARVPHGTRWDLDLPPLDAMRPWIDRVLEGSLARLDEAEETDAGLYWHRLALFHEQFHVEAFGYTWHALGYRQPGARWNPPAPMTLAPDAALPGGEMLLGSPADDGFVFDNEKWAHPVRVAPFQISRQPVTNAEFLQFVEDGGYHRARLWSPDAFARLGASGRAAPVNWRREGARWWQRWFDRWLPLEPFAPVVQVDAHEAGAYCAWAGRRLPTEVEWEMAASTLDDFDWGDSVWEWTASPFVPYPAFSADPYRDYSVPSFGTHRVVRGGSFATPEGLANRRLRNFYRPERGDVFVGLRTCALR
jgi:ergothioneine biosynthesis protein EgtB